MMDQIRQLQADITDHTIPVTAVLQKAIALASQLGNQDFTIWARQELRGYTRKDQEVDYRCLKGRYVVLTTDGRTVPIRWARSSPDMNTRFITGPLPEVESLLGGSANTFAVKLPDDLVLCHS
jgi:hypothetical protein